MFHRRRSRARRAVTLPSRRSRARSYRSPFLHGRKPLVELLEDRRLLAVVSVSNTLDNINGDTSSIAALIADDGSDGISLREAMTAANNTANSPAGTPDEIRFDGLAAGTQTIAIAMALPNITDAVIVDGYVNRAGATPNTNAISSALNTSLEIVIDGGDGAYDGFHIVAGGSGSTIRGLNIRDFGGDGIEIEDSSNNTIAGNFIGTNLAGNAADGNDDGVVIFGTSSNNRIGGTAAADRNLISGNDTRGVFMSNGASQNTVLGNFIGTAADGTSGLGNGNDGVWLNDGADGNTVGGTTTDARNVIADNAAGVRLNSVSGSMVLGNYIGVDRTGNADLGNNDDGIVIEDGSTSNTIGGTAANARNIISGNNANGVRIVDSDTTGNMLQGNYIGTDVDGDTDLGNSEDGVRIVNGASNNTIGGTAAGARNIISGNDSDGVRIEEAGTSGNMVFGNFIGINANGDVALGNGDDGVEISSGATNNHIGDNAAGARNVISANGDEGVEIADAGTSGNLVQGNFIGTAADGTSDLGNTNDGVDISNGATNNLVGGLDPGNGNTIAFNNDGVVVVGNASTGNKIQRNSIFSNDDLGIDLNDNGVTGNDGGDGDNGPNRLQNFPQFVGNATLLGDSIALRYRVNSAAANSAYPLDVEFFIADSDDQEGRTYLASDSYLLADAQMEKLVVIPAPAVLTNRTLVATATDADGNTSEFSLPVELAPPFILGSEPTVILPNQAIGQDQVDFYQYIAHSTGKLVVRIDFLHLLGDLALEVHSEDGTLLASSDTSTADQNFEQVIIPVVGQERYFISVIAIDFDGKQIQFYSLEVENFPAPVPAPPDLVAASDTGMMNDDNITADNTPEFRIQADLTDFANMGIPLLDQADIDSNNDGAVDATAGPGAGVFVTLTNFDTGDEFVGFATRVNSANPRFWSFNVTTPLPDGEYFVSAAVQIVDGADPRATGRGPLSDPLTIVIDTNGPNIGRATIDLLGYSDSGMYHDDNVTNKMQPAFGGLGPANAKVHVFVQKIDADPTSATYGMPIGDPLLAGSGVVGSELSDGNNENELGLWEVTVEPLKDGKYNVFARFESLSGTFSGPVGISADKINNTAQLIPDLTTITSAIQFAATDFSLVGSVPMTFIPVVDVNVVVNINHTADEDLDIVLISPAGTRIALSSDNGGLNDNYTDTVFDDEAGTKIEDGAAPFTGRFRPEEALSQLFNENAIGNWTLEITDDLAEFTGELLNWSLELVTPLMVVIDTVAPNLPYLDLLDDTGRHDDDNITKENMPRVTMTSNDPNTALAQLLFQDNLKFRIYDRYENTAEFLLYDSALDTDVDNMMVPGDMFTALTFIEEMLPEQFFADPPPNTNAAVINVDGVGKLADGVHNLKLVVEDRAGNLSHEFLLSITIDTLTPPVSFGLPDGKSELDGLTASSDTGVVTMPMTFADRVTSDTTPTLWGRAEANSIVRVYYDTNQNNVIDFGTDIFLGQTVAVPFDGNDAYPKGYWELTSVLDLNEIDAVSRDGLRQLLVTAEDVAGNPMKMNGVIEDGVDVLQIFIDTQGPRVTGVNLGPDIDFDLFDPKPSEDGPTPLVHSLFIDVEDFPARLAPDFLYEAIKEDIAETIGNYELIGDSVGQVVIEQVIVHFKLVASGQPAFASIELVFAEPLPDDRYTLTVRDNIVDPAGNRLDGESGAQDPSDDPIFPSGDGVPGGDFVARFTIDSRPEIGVWAAGIIHIDTNGNFQFDPENLDFTNRDLIYHLGFSSDYIFAGNFVQAAGAAADGFDKLAVYGRVGDQWRFLIDFDNDGVPDQDFVAPTINGLPVAGNFDGNAANGDEVGIFTGSAWYFDTNHDFIVDVGIASNYAGFPVVGDFDADGDDDVATYIASQSGGNQFHIDINIGGAGIINVNGVADHTFRVGLPGLGTFGFPGVRERPVAADMNGDGADDLGLWVPDGTAILPGDQGEWFFLLSDFERGENGGGVFVTETVIDRIVAGGTVDFVPFSITPFGQDLYARFGNSFALPIVGNFDPPVSRDGSSVVTAPATTPVTLAPVTETSLAIPPVQQPAEEPPVTAATESPTPTTTAPAASEIDTPPATNASPEPNSSDTPAATEPTLTLSEPAPVSPTSTPTTTTAAVITTTTVVPTKVAVPTLAPAATTTKSKTKSTTADTSTKPAKKLAVPALQSSSTNTAKQTNSKSATTVEAANTSETAIELPAIATTTTKKTNKSKKFTKSAKATSKLAIPEVSKPAKATKATKSAAAKKTIVAPPSKPAVTTDTSLPKTTKNTAAKTKVVATVVATPQVSTSQLEVASIIKTAGSLPAESGGGSVAVTTVTMPIAESASLAVAARPIVEVTTLEPTVAASSVVPTTTVQTVLTPAPVFELESAPAPLRSVQLSVTPEERPAAQSSASHGAGSVILQNSSLSGTLSIVGPDFTPSESAALHDTADQLLFEPALADAAITELLLTLADVTTDADDIAAERWTQPAETASQSGQYDASDGALALAVAWDSI